MKYHHPMRMTSKSYFATFPVVGAAHFNNLLDVPPLLPCRIFVATDERNETALERLRNNRVVLMSDLLGPTERRLVGWPMLISDIQAQVEQIVASHSGFFWGSRMSSVAGGIANMRAARGMDPRTARID
jgi:hypothetical protein